MIRRIDIISSLVIGEAAALLMLFISANITLPLAVRSYVSLLPFAFPFFTVAVMLVGSLLGARIAVAHQFTKFLLVGGLNFLIDLGVLNALILLTGVSQGALAVGFKAAGFTAAVISSFLWNKFWTFRAVSLEHAGLQFVEFVSVALIGLGLNTGIFAFVNDAIGPQGAIPPQTWANIAAVAAAAIGFVWNFLGYKYFVFRRPTG